MNTIARREFLTSTSAGAALIAFGSTAPAMLEAAAAAAADDGRILLVVELAGGNDGLNTVVLHSDPIYKKSRPKLAIAKADTLAIDQEIGLHPALRGFADLLEHGHFAVVQGVGYDNPNRSHFESMDIWHTCQRKGEMRSEGWIGRYLGASGLGRGSDPPALHFGSEKQPFALMSRDVRVPSIQSLEQFRFRGANRSDFTRTVRELSDAKRGDAKRGDAKRGDAERADKDDLLGFLQTSTSTAIDTSVRMESAGAQYKPSIPYPETSLGKKFETVAKLIEAGMKTKVYYVRIDGFDTHANQPAAHESLLREVGDAVSTLLQDLISHGHGDRLLAMCFSEFGRRVAENASDGTDHGTAGPMFFAGTKIRAGLVGEHPSLNDLEQGDLKFHTDFRQVYATVLQQWLNCPSRISLLSDYESIPLFA